MLLWIGFALLTAAVVAALLAPLTRERRAALDPAAADLAVYRDQLAEIESEAKRGLLPEADVAGARVEIARRILSRADAGSHEHAASPHAPEARRDRTVFLALAALIPLATVAGYLVLGSPALPDRPLSARLETPIEQASVGDLIARVEERLRQKPDDGQGWDVVAPIYLRLERYGDAAHAYAEANRLLGENVRRLAGFAEATLLASNGVVNDDVRRAAGRILELEPNNPEARIWIGLGKEQDGDLPGAIADYKGLLGVAPADAAWRKSVEDRIALLSDRLAGKPEPKPGDEAGRIAAMTPDEQAKMIGQMVDNLAQRLKENGRDLPGWLKLVRAYKVLGREADATAALGEARRAFAGDTQSLAALDELAKSLGLGS